MQVSDMVGNEESRSVAVKWLAQWRTGTKPLLLVGPPGTGKTTMAFLLARQFGYDVVGLNASDVRNKARINQILEPVLGNVAVTGQKTMIFIDEVDGIHGRGDYGGSAALADILRKSAAVPIILAANRDSADKMKPIKKAATTITFKRIPPRLMQAYLEKVQGDRIWEAEEFGEQTVGELDRDLLYRIVSRSGGDIRSMMNLAQSMSTGIEPQTEIPVEGLTTEQAINAFFEADTVERAGEILRRMQADPREKIGAFYSAVISNKNISPRDAAFCLEVLSESDMLYGRILRTQNWRLLRYLNGLLIRMHGRKGGGGRIRYVQYNLPFPVLTRIRSDRIKIRALADDLCKILHVSASTFASIYMPYMLYCMRADPSVMAAVTSDRDDGSNHADIIRKEIGRLPG